MAFLIIDRDPAEIFRKIFRGGRPLPSKLFRLEPAAGGQEIVGGCRRMEKDIAFRVGDEKQLATADRRIFGSPFSQDQFRRSDGGINLRDLGSLLLVSVLS